MNVAKSFTFRGGRQVGLKDVEAFEFENKKLAKDIRKKNADMKDLAGRVDALEKDN